MKRKVKTPEQMLSKAAQAAMQKLIDAASMHGFAVADVGVTAPYAKQREEVLASAKEDLIAYMLKRDRELAKLRRFKREHKPKGSLKVELSPVPHKAHKDLYW